MPKINVVRVGILDPDAQPARFSLSIFGIPARDLTAIGSDEPLMGSRPIVMALQDHRNYQRSDNTLDEGEDSLLTLGYTSSPFMISEVHPEELCPPKRERFIQRSKLADDFS